MKLKAALGSPLLADMNLNPIYSILYCMANINDSFIFSMLASDHVIRRDNCFKYMMEVEEIHLVLCLIYIN